MYAQKYDEEFQVITMIHALQFRCQLICYDICFAKTSLRAVYVVYIKAYHQVNTGSTLSSIAWLITSPVVHQNQARMFVTFLTTCFQLVAGLYTI